jgi:hypothetical protein
MLLVSVARGCFGTPCVAISALGSCYGASSNLPPVFDSDDSVDRCRSFNRAPFVNVCNQRHIVCSGLTHVRSLFVGLETEPMIRKTLLHCALTIATFLCMATSLVAQTAGGIAGVVRDSSGGVLPGVTVEASKELLVGIDSGGTLEWGPSLVQMPSKFGSPEGVLSDAAVPSARPAPPLKIVTVREAKSFATTWSAPIYWRTPATTHIRRRVRRNCLTSV